MTARDVYVPRGKKKRLFPLRPVRERVPQKQAHDVVGKRTEKRLGAKIRLLPSRQATATVAPQGAALKLKVAVGGRALPYTTPTQTANQVVNHGIRH